MMNSLSKIFLIFASGRTANSSDYIWIRFSK